MRRSPSTVSVRTATEADLQEVVLLFREVLANIPYYNSMARKGERSKYTVRDLRTKLRNDKYSVVVARDKSGLLGFAFSHFDDYLIWIDWLAVNPTSRRLGVGSLIIRKVIKTSSERRAHKIWCDTRSTNEPAKLTLRKNGFREIAVVRNHWYGQDFILWERPVQTAKRTHHPAG